MAAPIPFTVIGGFLGAGKTTLLNRLLRQDRRRLAVLVNDFGAVDIDADLVASHDGETISLYNGCICCTLATGFSDALVRLLDSPEPPEHIVVEASGVGDPWSIAEIALLEPDLRLAAAIVLADAEQAAAHLADPALGDTVRRQFRRADLVLLNKTDLVDAAGLERARAAIRAVRPDVRLIETKNAALPLALLDFDHAATEFAAPEFHDDDHDDDHGIRSWLFRAAGALDRRRFEAMLAVLPPSLVRLKGWCRFAGEEGAHLLQMTGARWALSPAAATAAPPDDTVIVVLGTPAMPEAADLIARFDATRAGGAAAWSS